MITVPDAARRTGRSPETIRRWIRAGKLPATKVGTQHLVDERDLDALAGSGRAARSAVGEGAAPYLPEPKDDASIKQLTARIVADRRVLTGKPVIRGTRISVELVLELLAAGWTPDDLTQNYPTISIDDVRACMAYAALRIEDEALHPMR